MFSTARFNATKLNVGASVNEVLLQTIFSEMLISRMGVGVELHVDSLAFSSALDQQALGAAAVPAELSLVGLLRSTASALLAAPIETVFSEALNATSVHVMADHFLSGDLSAALTAKATGGAMVWFVTSLSDSLTGASQIGAEMASNQAFSEIVTLSPDAGAQEEQRVLIRVTVPAGSELRIDSERYTVTLDGKNILHLQEGDWIALDRELAQITLDSGTKAQLQGSVVWTERYL